MHYLTKNPICLGAGTAEEREMPAGEVTYLRSTSADSGFDHRSEPKDHIFISTQVSTTALLEPSWERVESAPLFSVQHPHTRLVNW